MRSFHSWIHSIPNLFLLQIRDFTQLYLSPLSFSGLLVLLLYRHSSPLRGRYSSLYWWPLTTGTARIRQTIILNFSSLDDAAPFDPDQPELEHREFCTFNMNPPLPVIDTTSNQAEPTPQSASVPAYSRPSPHFRRHQRRSTGMSISPSMALINGEIGDGLSGRATRQRTQLIVEGFTNLALVVSFVLAVLDGGISDPVDQKAVLFSGVLAQIVSVTNGDNNNSLAVATNAAFFGGLMLSVFSALLATRMLLYFFNRLRGRLRA